ncbi:MAG: cupin domain-containing protein [Gemmatimonadales bacterium]
MFSYPHTIENGLGERITFLRRVTTPEGEALEVDNTVQPGIGPPMHVHRFQEEALTVVTGRIGYQRKGGQAQFAGPGESVVFLAGESHRFWNAGTDELRCTGYIRPPDNIEYFLRALFEAQKKSGGVQPDKFEAAYLISRYRSEFGMDEIPAIVQRIVFPAVVLLGHLLGKYRKFADAPPPVQGRPGTTA